MKNTFGDTKGFTLLEFVVVVALAAALIGMTAILLTRGRAAANFSTTQERLRLITAGLSECRMFRNSLPLEATINTTWPAALNPYIEADFRAEGTHVHGYQCNAGTNSVTIRTPIFESPDAAEQIRAKLVDQNVCTNGSTLTGSQIDCVLSTFANTAQCQ